MTTAPSTPSPVLRPHAEVEFAAELVALSAQDTRERPTNWRLSPWAVVAYLMGGELADGTVITPKYVGNRRLMEMAVATLATDRALLLTEGPTPAALVPSPVQRAMERGAIVRVEELTRMPSDVQDALVTVLSEKALPVPELGTEVQAVPGFNLIATANDRDRGVNDLSAALRRRFNTVVLPLPADPEEEVRIVQRRVAELGAALRLPEVPAGAEEIRRVVTVFRELRSGATEDGKVSVKVPSGSLSTAEAISVVVGGMALAAHFGDGSLSAADVAAGMVGAVVKDPVHDAVAWREYLEAVVRDRAGWDDLYDACRAL